MNFKNPLGTTVMVGTTDKKNTIEYFFTAESRLKFWQPCKNLSVADIVGMKLSDLNKHHEVLKSNLKATMITLNCSFAIKAEMATLLDNSKIVHIHSFSNKEEFPNEIILSPLPMFTYEKFNDLLYDLSQKFGI